jgi:CHU_C Type IX secretion signal domain
MISMKTTILSPMKSWLISFSFITSIVAVFGQSAPGSITVSTGTSVATSSSSQIALTGDLTVNSDGADLSKSTLVLVGSDQDLRMTRGSSLLVLGGIIIGPIGGGTGGTKNLFGGTWEIAGTLVFNDGIVVPQTGSNGKLVHSQSPGSTSSITVNNPDSYFNGTFYSKGTGTRYFPIGNGTGYFPAQLSNMTEDDLEIGMLVRNQNSALTHGTEILSIFNDQYWELLDASGSLEGPVISISTLGAGGYINPNIGTVLFSGAATSLAGESLEGSINGDFLVGGKTIKAGNRIFTMAQVSSELVNVKIHNVITPFIDNANDYLQIENISLFPDNKVTLLDRWGVQVKTWTGFENVTTNPGPTYDLSKVPTGNYIVLLEYKDGSTVKKLSQMVTIINQ